jgi:hypothetical protein
VDKAAGLHFHAGLLKELVVTASILRSRQLLLEIPQPESHMNALVENASEPWVSFKEQDPLQAGAGCTHGNRHSCGSASNDDDIVMVKVQHKKLGWSNGVME